MLKLYHALRGQLDCNCTYYTGLSATAAETLLVHCRARVWTVWWERFCPALWTAYYFQTTMTPSWLAAARSSRALAPVPLAVERAPTCLRSTATALRCLNHLFPPQFSRLAAAVPLRHLAKFCKTGFQWGPENEFSPVIKASGNYAWSFGGVLVGAAPFCVLKITHGPRSLTHPIYIKRGWQIFAPLQSGLAACCAFLCIIHKAL